MDLASELLWAPAVGKGGSNGQTDCRQLCACQANGPFSRLHLTMWRLFKEFLLFARQEKKWWLIPLIVLLLVLGGILIFASSSGIAWALYPFF